MMNKLSKQKVARVLGILVALLLVFPLAPPTPVRAEITNGTSTCHFAITVPYDVGGYPVEQIGVGSILNWGVYPPFTIPANIEHTKVLRVRNDLYDSTKTNLAAFLSTYPGHVWIIGNEPDARVHNQDEITPSVYAQRFKELAEMIRSLDPSAKIGFGPVIQPSPLRIEYLNRVFTTLDGLTGSRANSLALIDIFTPHAFILNEAGIVGESWGAYVPLGLEDRPDLVFDITSQIHETHNINIFRQWVTDFRKQMKFWGAQNKPLWITEYGSLLPSVLQDGSPGYVSDAETVAYMTQTFDFIMGDTSDPLHPGKSADYGFAGDENRLVQRGYWYSLNEYRYRFGGSLYDPMNKTRTSVGDAYVSYNPVGLVTPVAPDAKLLSARVSPLRYTPGTNKTEVDYRVDLLALNNVDTDLFSNATIELYEGTTLLGSATGALTRCRAETWLTLIWVGGVPGTHDLEAKIISAGDIDPSNNTLAFSVTIGEPLELYLPITAR